jgi:hypothetical protein
MTECEWATSTDPQAMLRFVLSTGLASERKVRLFAVACWRRIRREGLWTRLVRAIETAERYADGWASRQELLNAKSTACKLAKGVQRLVYDPMVWPPGFGPRLEPRDLLLAAYAAEERPVVLAERMAEVVAWPEVREAGPNLLRDLFGPPIAIELSWRTPDVVSLAQDIYENPGLEGLPMLADALQKVGCTDAGLLGHLRGPGPHARGCWALDQILGTT